MFGFVDGFVSLDEDSSALALHSDGGVVVENVTSLCEVTVPPHLQMGLTSQPRGNLQTHKHEDKSKLKMDYCCFKKKKKKKSQFQVTLF